LIKNRLYNIANGLGFTFTGGINNYTVPPEVFIVELIKECGLSLIKKETRFHSLLRTWININSHLLRTDALLKLSIGLDDVELRILGSLCAIARDSDSKGRWLKIISHLKNRLQKNEIDVVSNKYPREALDTFLNEFGVNYRKIPFQEDRKFMDRKWLVKNNPWIKGRLLMSVSPRADLATFFRINKERNCKKVCELIFIGRSSFFALKEDIELVNSFVK
jgi:hypothetical protein